MEKNVLKLRPSIAGELNPAKRPEVREKIRLSKIGIKRSPEMKKNLSETRKRLFAEGKLSITPKQRENISDSLLGRKVTWGDKISKAEIGKKMSEVSKQQMKLNHWSKSEDREKVIEKIICPSMRQKQRERKLKEWQDPVYREKTIKNVLNALYHNKPTSYEKRIAELCIENNLPFIFCGNGTFLIGQKNPDFVNKKDKIAIEVFNDYFKIRNYGSVEEYIKVRSEYFAKFGYKVIFIGSKEVMNKNWEEICLNKIKIVMGEIIN